MKHKASCVMCGGPWLIRIREFERLSRITSDVKPWKSGGKLAVCKSCGLVQKLIDPKWLSESKTIYASYSPYYQADGAEQAVYETNARQLSPRSQIIIKKLMKQFSLPQKGSLLDVGCGNGAFLKVASLYLSKWHLYGNEQSRRHIKELLMIKGLKSIYIKKLSAIERKFDLISVMHVLEHISSPKEFLMSALNRLNKNGIILLQTPNLDANPFDLLIADHCLHFSRETLANLMSSSGYCVNHLYDDWISKEFTAVLRKNEKTSAPFFKKILAHKTIRKVKAQVAWLKKFVAHAKQVSHRKEFGILGTSIVGTWLAHQLGKKVSFFVDEDLNRIGKKHLNQAIYSIVQIPKSAHVFIALPFHQAKKFYSRAHKQRPDVHFYIPRA